MDMDMDMDMNINNTVVIEKNGVACPIPLSQILFNASICSQQVSNFSSMKSSKAATAIYSKTKQPIKKVRHLL
jgi:hypothetical protein